MNNVFFIHFPLPFAQQEDEPIFRDTIFSFLFDEGDYLSLLDLQQQDFYLQTKEENEARFATHEWSEIPFLGPEGGNTLGYTVHGFNLSDQADRARALSLMQEWHKMFFNAGLEVSPIIPLVEGDVEEGVDVPEERSPWDPPQEEVSPSEQQKDPVLLSLYEQALIKWRDLDLTQ